MRELNRKTLQWGIIVVINLLTCVLSFFVVQVISWALCIATFAGIVYLCLIIKKRSTAQLICENSILTINQIEMGKQSVTVIISCFGILFDGKPYKFNREGIRLIKVDINRVEITLCFSNEEKQNKIKVLHGLFDKSEADKIAEKFRYETGVVPIVENW